MDYLQVKNWHTFQHYTMRNPPWIRVYNTLLEDPAFAGLPDAGKAHLVGIWLYASRADNRIPKDAAFIAGRINASTPVDLDLLVLSGFLEPYHPASNKLADCKRHASNLLAQNRTEQKRTEENRAEKSSACSASAKPPLITHEEENRNAEVVWEQIKETPEGKAIAEKFGF